MSMLSAALIETAEHPQPSSLEGFRLHIDPEWIEQALQATGTATLRRRRLPAEQVIWLVLGMALMRNRPIAEVASKLDLALPGSKGSASVASSSIVQARQRVGSEPLSWLFEHCSSRWAHPSARRHAWRELSLYGLDGTTLRVADSDDNRAHFGLASGPRGDSGYPLVRLVALMALRSHLLVSARFGPYSQGEHGYAKELWAEIPDDSLTIVDKNFMAAQVLLGLERAGRSRHWLLRAKSNTSWCELQSLGQSDKLVELEVSSAARKQDPSLPKTFVARAIGYRHPGSDGQQWLLTSLRDAKRYPVSEIVALYHERWEIELGYDEVKTHMLEREETIRSRTVDGVYQELWGILLAYNLVRLEMERIADQARLPPSRISFITALRFIRDEWLWSSFASPGSIPSKLARMRESILDFVLPPRRPARRFPRAVKIKMSNYPKKRRKNAQRGTK